MPHVVTASQSTYPSMFRVCTPRATATATAAAFRVQVDVGSGSPLQLGRKGMMAAASSTRGEASQRPNGKRERSSPARKKQAYRRAWTGKGGGHTRTSLRAIDTGGIAAKTCTHNRVLRTTHSENYETPVKDSIDSTPGEQPWMSAIVNRGRRRTGRSQKRIAGLP